MSRKRTISEARTGHLAAEPEALLVEVRQFIIEAWRQTAHAVNAGLTLLYWRIGDRIRREVLNEQRAGYGEQIVSGLGRQLESEFGRVLVPATRKKRSTN